MESATQVKRSCATEATLLARTPICHEHLALEFASASFPQSNPGQFLLLLCRAADEAAATEIVWPAHGFPSLSGKDLCQSAAYLRRPFSIADQWTDEAGVTHLSVISHSVGPGTRWLSRLRPGDHVNVTGPLGRGFHAPSNDVSAILIGGGVGIAPLLYLARWLHEAEHEAVTAIFGARRRELLPLRLLGEPAQDMTPTACVELPGQAPYPAIIASDDGSIGLRGVVTDALRACCARSGKRAVVFACGPDAMLRAVATLTRELGLSCQLCIERNMGCGMGACQSCVVRNRAPGDARGWRWALACQDGPVFQRDELLDYDPAPSA